MAHRANKFFAITLVGLVSACAAPLRMPEGVYSDSSGRTLTVSGNDLLIQVRPDETGIASASTSVIYRLESDGRLRLAGSSNSSVFVFFVIGQDWRWTGAAIESRDRRHGKVVTYAPVR